MVKAKDCKILQVTWDFSLAGYLDDAKSTIFAVWAAATIAVLGANFFFDEAGYVVLAYFFGAFQGVWTSLGDVKKNLKRKTRRI